MEIGEHRADEYDSSGYAIAIWQDEQDSREHKQDNMRMGGKQGGRDCGHKDRYLLNENLMKRSTRSTSEGGRERINALRLGLKLRQRKVGLRAILRTKTASPLRCQVKLQVVQNLLS